jgi:4-amino-4-deoxy-L-arabinose transferase-like glycosyltransferase
VRVAFIALANQSALTFHSGGSDAPSYVLLAQNLLARAGFTYAGLPSAVRPPGYPMLVAASMLILGDKYILGIRCLQFALGIATVTLCAATARHLFGERAARATLLIGLFLPTLIFTTAQVLTECLAAFLTAVFLRSLILQCTRGDARSAWTMGWTAGIESMIRFNAAALPLFAGLAIWKSPSRRIGKNLAIALGIPLLIVLPWLIRNEIAFHGEVLYSTQGGPNAVQGVLTSEGRTQPGDSETLRKNLGWELHQIETNDSSRLLLPSEAALDRRAIAIVPALWERQRWHVFPLLIKKFADFSLSMDQLAGTTSLAAPERAIRFGGVLAYWAVLVLAILGWSTLRRTNEPLAAMLVIYAAGFTLLHLPLVMNTRLRIPLLEPLFVTLAGAGWMRLSQSWTSPRGLADSAIDPAARISIVPRSLPVSDSRRSPDCESSRHTLRAGAWR